MESKFNSRFFAGNRQRLRQSFTGTAPIVITANGRLQRGTDSTYAFAQDANFWYLTGIDEPDVVLVMDQADEYLILPELSAYQRAFDGEPDRKQLAKRSGVKTAYDAEAGWEKLGAKLAKVRHAATLGVPPAYVDVYGMYTNPARAALRERLKTYKKGLEFLDVNQHLTKLRMIKQPDELAAIQAAIDITIDTIKDITKPARLKAYKYEYELEAELSRGFRNRGAGHAFDPIVAGGKRACTLHNVANNGPLASDELIILDVGAEVEHSAADITRVLNLAAPTARQQAVHAAVLEIQKFGFSLLKPGVQIKDYEQQIEHFMGDKLSELGLIKEISHEAVRKFYPHSTSHFLGLNVHDVGDYERPLEPGMVLTVEPGIYIPGEGIGVRIEDDVLLTDKGIKILSDKLSWELR
jgi:Xaa-Pro aminopeptidase